MGDITTGLAALSINAHTYKPLPPSQDGSRWIRIVDVLPSRSKSGPLRLRLRTAALTPELKYSAISYVWGDGTNECEVEIFDEGSVASKLTVMHMRLLTRQQMNPL
jgi:hypothetical protein